MSGAPFRGAFSHQHGDPRTLAERIEAQLRERIQEAVEMAGLELMVERRRVHGRPAPSTSSDADRREFEHTAAEFLRYLHSAFAAELTADIRAPAAQAEAGSSEADRLLAGQAFLAARLPDYWQRLESHRAAYLRERLEPPSPQTGWLTRLFRSS